MSSTNPIDWLLLQRIVRFGDIDSAGVIHFHHLLRWSHEAWEESLHIYGLKAIDIFPSLIDSNSFIHVALPIVHCEADFFAPVRLANELEIELSPLRLDAGSFQVKYVFKKGDILVASSLIRHRAIYTDSRHPCDLPEGIDRWLEVSSLNRGISAL